MTVIAPVRFSHSRNSQHPRSFQKLENLSIHACRACMPAQLWFPFLHLFRHASLYSVRNANISDSVSVMALSPLPMIRCLCSSGCTLPDWVRGLCKPEQHRRITREARGRRFLSNAALDFTQNLYMTGDLDSSSYQFLCLSTDGVDGRTAFFAAVYERLRPADQSLVQRYQSMVECQWIVLC